MKFGKPLFFTKIFLFALQAVKTATSEYKGCFKVDPATKTCTLCYKSQPLGLGKGCGSLDPALNNCLISKFDLEYQRTECSTCQPGSVLLVHFDGRTPECLTPAKNAAQIPDNCQYATQTDQEDKITCIQCKDTYYTHKTFQKEICTPISQVTNPKAKKLVKNCLSGLYYAPVNKMNCLKCQPGFSITVEDYFECTPAPSKGCLHIYDDKSTACLMCDAEAGWYMNKEGVCVKDGLLEL